MSVLPPGATNSNVPPWATASSPVEQPVSSTSPASTAALTRATNDLIQIPQGSV